MNASKNAPVSLVAYVSLIDSFDKGIETTIFIEPVSSVEPKSQQGWYDDEFSDRLQYQLTEKPEYSNQTRLRFKKKDYKLANLRACFDKILVEDRLKYGQDAYDLQMYLQKHEPYFSTPKGSRILREVFSKKADKIKTALVIGFITNHLLMATGHYMKNGVVPTL